MNTLEMLGKEITFEVPSAKVSIDAPASQTGTAYLDIDVRRHHVVVAWNPEKGFGVSTSSTVGYGERSHETYDTRLGALQRVLEILKKRQKTHTTIDAPLSKIRKSRKVSQKDLATALDVQQASISKVERRADLQVSTLRKVVSGLGGELEIYARFPEVSFRLVQPKTRRRRTLKRKHAKK